MDDLTLLRLELETLWVTDGDGRLLYRRTSGQEPAPLLVVAGGPAGVCWATSVDVPDDVRTRAAALLTDEPSPVAVGWAPSRADALADALAPLGPLAVPQGGPSYVVPVGGVPPRDDVDVRSSAEMDLASLRGRMPEHDRALPEPWVVALVDDRVAAVCETARAAPGSVEAGVWTYEPHRRRGLATAVTAAWSTLVADRTAFYSTSWDNVASQGVARRLGLHPVGQWWHVSLA